jgi:shikimate dehydrogenase
MTNAPQPLAHKTGLVGYPVEHSLSPAMLNAVYEYYDINWSYKLYSCESNTEFHDLITQVQDPANGFVGLNITMPYKTEAAQLVLVNGGKLIASAEVIRAINVLSRKPAAGEKDQLLGRNVDGSGLVASLLSRSKLVLRDAAVLISGTGAVTSAACLALANTQVAAITVVSRRRQRAVDFVSRFADKITARHPDLVFKGIGYDEVVAVKAEMHKASLVIDATPIGMYADDMALLPLELITPQHTVLDVVYGHGETQLLKAARQAGAMALDGLGMLVEQAALTFEAWVADQALPVQINHEKTIDIMNKAALAELERRALLT